MYNIIILELSTTFYVMYNYITMTMIYDRYDIVSYCVTVCDITLTLNPKFKNKKIDRKKNRNKK